MRWWRKIATWIGGVGAAGPVVLGVLDWIGRYDVAVDLPRRWKSIPPMVNFLVSVQGQALIFIAGILLLCLTIVATRHQNKKNSENIIEPGGSLSIGTAYTRTVPTEQMHIVESFSAIRNPGRPYLVVDLGAVVFNDMDQLDGFFVSIPMEIFNRGEPTHIQSWRINYDSPSHPNDSVGEFHIPSGWREIKSGSLARKYFESENIANKTAATNAIPRDGRVEGYLYAEFAGKRLSDLEQAKMKVIVEDGAGNKYERDIDPRGSRPATDSDLSIPPDSRRPDPP